jgi:nucleotide-binding universal stress UspA family protein
MARNLAAQYGARLSMLHVLTSPEATGVWTPEVFMPASAEARERLTLDAQQRIESSLTAEDRTRSDVTILIRIGSVAEHILDFARERGVDLIVMGTHGRRGLSHLLLGSVAEQVLRSAPCPVLTTRAMVETEEAAEAEASAGYEAVTVPSFDQRKIDDVC